MNLRVLSSLEIENNDPHFWERIEEEIAEQINDLEAMSDCDISLELRNQLKRDCFIAEFDRDTVHIAVDYSRYVEVVNQAFEV